MSEQILFLQKNEADFSKSWVTATASEGNDYANRVLNRSNLSAWITTGSTDASLTTLTIDMVDARAITDIILIKHNFKNFTVKYWDGATYQPFSPAISETTNTAASNSYEVTQVSTSKIQITVNGTMVVDDDKYLFQFIASKRIGQLAGWPVIKNPLLERNKKSTKMLSGKLNIAENIGKFSCELTVKEWTSSADLTIVEALFNSPEGFLVWLCGGSESQFASTRQGYRHEDIFLMKCVNDYEPEYVEGQYLRGLDIKIKLAEVID